MSSIDSITSCGPVLRGNTCTFNVWAPLKKSVTLHLVNPDQQVKLMKDRAGYFSTTLEGVKAGTDYFFSADGGSRLADPASHYQPDGVHGPSCVVDHSAFRWTDEFWRGIPMEDLILYEAHAGTFTTEGTFEAIIPLLKELSSVGINAIELMPVAQFPGNRNWGYDGVFPYAVHNTYGGPEGLKKLVNACHMEGIAVVLDVVYNHLGPEGNCFKEYGPYFTGRYSTPWGDAINFDDAWSDGVREYFCANALYWFHHYHIDGLRLDAVHMIFDNGAVHFLQYLNERVHAYEQHAGRPLHMIAESDLNSPRVINAQAIGGYGFRAQWLDDFHHALYVSLDEKGRKRYEDFRPIEHVAKAFKDGFVHSGEYVKFRKRRHGTTSAGIPGDKFVAFTSNHDQIGNRPAGERLTLLLDFERLKIAAAALMVSPYIPMLFMGDEYGEESPFFYFISHSDPDLIEKVRKGRKEEFSDFNTGGESPDPQDARTFERCILQWNKRNTGRHRLLLSWHAALIAVRNTMPALKNFCKNDVRVTPIGDSMLSVYRHEPGGMAGVLCLMNFAEKELSFVLPPITGDLKKILDSRDRLWSENGAGLMAMPETLSVGVPNNMPPLTFALYTWG